MLKEKKSTNKKHKRIYQAYTVGDVVFDVLNYYILYSVYS